MKMNGPAPLFIGLGGIGRAALGRIASFSGQVQGHAKHLLWIDQDYQVALDARTRLLEGNGVWIPAISLAGVEARLALTRLIAWRSVCKWLPEGDALRLLNEIGPTSASGFRFLGRLSLVRAPHALDSGLRQALGYLSERRPLLKDVVVIAGAEGGTGSAVLADVSILIRQLLPGVTVRLFLVLPPANLSERCRFSANTYATLKELSALRDGVSFGVLLEGQYVEQPRGYKDDLWQRVFVFSAQEQELPPYPATLDVMVEAISVMFEEEMYLCLQESAAPHVHLDLGEVRKLFFAGCGGFRLRLEDRDVLWTPSASKPQLIPAPIQVQGTGSPEKVPAFHARAWEIRKNSDESLLNLRYSLRELRGGEVGRAHHDILKIESEILASDDGSGENALRRLLEEVKVLHQEAESMWSEGSRLRRSWWMRFRVCRIRHLEDRIDTLRAVFRELPDGTAPRTPAPKLPGFVAVEVLTTSVHSEEAWQRKAVNGAWKKVEDILRSRAFLEVEHSAARKRVIILLPEQLSDQDREMFESRFRILAGPLNCGFEIRRSRGEDILFYYEELFHHVGAIARLPVYRTAYESFAFPAALHTDRAFVDYPLEPVVSGSHAADVELAPGGLLPPSEPPEDGATGSNGSPS